MSSPGWELFIAARWIAWELTWLGMMFFCFQISVIVGDRLGPAFKWILSFTATLYVLDPVSGLLIPAPRLFEWFPAAAAWACIIASFLFYQQLSTLTARIPAPALRLQLQIISILIPMGIVAARTQTFGHQSTRGLGSEILAVLPSAVFGCHGWMYESIKFGLWYGWRALRPENAVIIATPIWARCHRLARLASLERVEEGDPLTKGEG